ncbi:hypothetical protein [Rhodopirellula bahusiensis]|uniref:hypothetical protein n=1 Tax=Rhodopirellula bahusiensis TaxID=2014065 RepID=UPI0032646A1B
MAKPRVCNLVGVLGEQVRVELSADYLLSWAHCPGFRDRRTFLSMQLTPVGSGPLKNSLAVAAESVGNGGLRFHGFDHGDFDTLGAPGAWYASFMIAGSRVAKRNPRYNRFPLS